MADEKPKKHRWLIWLTILSVLVLLVSPFVLFRYQQRAVFERKVRELAEAGYPVSDEDLQALYVLPEGVQNAADLYQRAFALYVEPNETQQALLPVTGNYEQQQSPFGPEVLNAIEKSLSENQEYLALLDEAAQIEHCLFPRTFNGVSTMIPYLSDYRQAAKVIQERNMLLAQTGQTDALFESVQTGISLVKRSSPCPFLIEGLVTIAIERMVTDSLQDSIDYVHFSEAQLAVLQRQIRELYSTDVYTPGLITEQAQIIEIVDLPPSMFSMVVSVFGGSSFSQKAIIFLYYLSGLKEKDAVYVLDVLEAWIESTALPLHEQCAELDRLDKELQTYSTTLFNYRLMTGFFPSFRVGKIFLRSKGQLACAETALAVERYRLKYNALPETLEGLVPEFMEAVYPDPFDGKPLRYIRHESGGYTVYTVGEDGIDNGGLDEDRIAEQTGDENPDEYDYPFSVNH